MSSSPRFAAETAFQEVLAQCYPVEMEAVGKGRVSTYEDFLLYFRHRGYKTQSAAGNVARLLCYLMERAGMTSPRAR
jgi:hypothetical protein